MLFEFGFMAMAVLCPVLVLLAYRMGVRDGQRVGKGVEVQPLPSVPRKRRDGIEDNRLMTLLDNINAYDGTERGQKEIK